MYNNIHNKFIIYRRINSGNWKGLHRIK